MGELLITFGAVILLYVAYSLWFTNSLAEVTTRSTSADFLAEIEERKGQPGADRPPLADGLQTSGSTSDSELSDDDEFVPVEPFALLYIPRLEADVWEEPLVSGIGYRALASGVGHYPSTELPGEVGNFAIAGHRATNGEPFAYFENLQAGDRVYVQTLEGWFEYELVRDKIIQEDEVWVLGDSPEGQGFEPGSRLITLTTCHPRWNSYQRWAWWGELVATYPLSDTPAEILERG